MASATLEHLLQEIKALDPAERAELRQRLDSLDSSEEAVIREVDHRLTETGMLESAPAPITDWSRILDWQPVKMEGRPLSEIIIEERR